MELTIIQTSDVHGYIMPTNYSQQQMNLPFGLVKVASVIKQIKERAKGPIIQVDNGDFIQGSPLSYYIKKQPNRQVKELTHAINMLQYDVSVLGNHEFNYGLAYLNEAIQSYQHPVICANILNKQGECAFGKPYIILEKEGVKIAILGLTTPYIPHWEQPETVRDLTFVSAVETAKQYVPKLREIADIVIVAYHGGFEKDLQTGTPTELLTGENEGYDLVTSVPGIDVLLTGHQHRVIAEKINGIPVVQPGYRGNYISEVTLNVQKQDGKYCVVNSSCQLHSCENIEADDALMANYHSLQQDVEVWLDQNVGQVIGDMTITDSNDARLKDHPYIEFINSVQMSASGASISATALFNNEGRGFNANITMRDVITNYIYPNTLAVLEITGDDLKQALEQCANYYIIQDGEIVFNPIFVEPKPQYYNYDIYDGIDYAIDFTKPVGSRVVQLQFNGKDIQPDDKLELVTNQYRAVGGGNYSMFKPEKIVREIQIDMTELIADYLKEHQTIHASVQPNYKTIF